MRTTLRFRGHSDDLVVVSRDLGGENKTNELSAYGDGIATTLTIVAPSGHCEHCGSVGKPEPIAQVLALYVDPGVWTFAVAQIEEGANVPLASRLEPPPGGYSMTLVVEHDAPLGLMQGDRVIFGVAS